MQFQPLASTDPLLSGFMNPELMSIGDSIFNGVRSLSIDENLANTSPPAFLARGLGLPMVQPDYPRPVLFDLEREVRDGIDLSRIRSRIIDNGEKWLSTSGAWSDHRFFDNIAVAGYAYDDLHRATAGAARNRIDILLDKVMQSPGLDFASIVNLYTAINTAFVLNPSGHPGLNDLTPLEQVASRQPKRLLINIGNNEGLFLIGVTASYSRQFIDQLRRIPDHATKLASVLKDHCPNVDRFYFNLLIRPRVVANLAPRTDSELTNPPRGGGYFERYVARLGPALNRMSADQMRDFDREIAQVNDATRKAIAKVFGADKGRFVFVDLYKLLNQFDAKHLGKAGKVEVDLHGKQKRLSNYPFSALVTFRHGGIFGLDNMHPSNVGYAILANFMGEAIAKAEAGTSFDKIDLQDATDGDTLLQDPPGSWDVLTGLLSLLTHFVKLDLA